MESTACIAIFYGLYLLIFRRFTFVRLNRVYLLSSLIIGLIFPLISYEVEEIVKVPVNQIVYSERNFQPVMVNSSTSLIVNEPVENVIDWDFMIEIIYVLVIVLMAFRFLIMIYKLLKIKRISIGGDYISTQSRFANSSFFNLIFIDDSNLTQDEIQQILAHEKWHIKLFHSYDLLFVEILKILFWFNPILWLYQRSLSEVHEYEVDTRMIQNYNPQSYAQLLLKLATSNSTLATTHHFSRKPLTDRIHFIFTKQKSVPMKRLAYLSILPILGVLFMAFSLEKVVKYQEIEDSSKHFKIVRGNKINISESDMSKLAIMRLMDDEIQLFIGFDKLTNESIEEAKSYFKDYGFSLNMIDYQVDKKNVLTNIEFSLLEDDKTEKEKNRNRNYEMYNDGGKFDLEEYRKLSKEDKGMFLSIRANKKTGIHTVNLGHIPPTPPAPPRPPLAPKAPKASPILPAPPKPPLAPKLGFLNNAFSDSVKLIGEGQLGKNPLVFINGKSYPSNVLYKLNPTKISNSTIYKREGVLKKFGVENTDGAIEINTFNRSNEDLFLSKKQLNIAVENERKRREARSSGKSLTRVTLKDFNGNEKDEIVVYKDGSERASATVSKGGQILFQVGDVVKTEDEMKEINSQLLGSTVFASEEKKTIEKLGMKINGKPIEAIMKFNQ
ncbi:M56 family metallopeptidase [Arcicella sp. LKC2W]|uniref:M56 family metallopeptidase n=1 Tax=Arcicella sp. LKC2W TaxID=2984198 RepID=UPI002B1F3203|nr:M56 family metallopeptidase [Arcicella sp. LKC2W]MEA5461348.1 M56 family metallopeptidase [Arcicella sp. LKC2W]